MSPFTSDGDWLTVSDIVEYSYCPRKFYLIKALSLPAMEMKKMSLGREEAERNTEKIEELIKSELGDGEFIRGWRGVDEELRLSGAPDFVFRNEEVGIVPIEVKYSKFERLEAYWKKQIYAYSLLIEKEFGNKVERGFVVILPSMKILEVFVSEENKLGIIRDLERMRRILLSEKIPRKSSEWKCNYCEMNKFC